MKKFQHNKSNKTKKNNKKKQQKIYSRIIEIINKKKYIYCIGDSSLCIKSCIENKRKKHSIESIEVILKKRNNKK